MAVIRMVDKVKMGLERRSHQVYHPGDFMSSMAVL